MTRFAFTAAESASSAAQIQYRTFVDIGVTSGTMYVCNGTRYIYTLGNTYSPVGGLGGIDPIGDESDVQPSTMRMWLCAVASTDMYEPSREDMFNRPAVVRHGYLDPVTGTLVSTPELLWKGFINKVDIRFADVERGNFFEVEAETSMRRKAEVVNFTTEAHQTVMAFSGDTFFSFIHQVPVVKALWGNQATTFNGAAPGHWGYSRTRTPGAMPTRGGWRTWIPGG